MLIAHKCIFKTRYSVTNLTLREQWCTGTLCNLGACFQFKVDGEWWTWIDYDQFHGLVRRWKDTHGSATFGAEDYMAKTPHWAVYGAKEQGFDPAEKRFYRKKRKDISGC